MSTAAALDYTNVLPQPTVAGSAASVSLGYAPPHCLDLMPSILSTHEPRTEKSGDFGSTLSELSERRGREIALASTAMTLAHYSAAASAGMTRHSEMILILLGETEEAILADE